MKSNLSRIIILTLLAVLMVSLGGTASASSPALASSPQEIQITDQYNGQAVDLNGEVLVLNLESNPSTGYGWQVQGLDPRILRQVDATEWVPDTPGKLGGPGTQVLRFAAVGKGQDHAQPRLCPPLGEPVRPAKSFSLEVQVTEPSRNVSYPQPAAEEPRAAAADGASLAALPTAYNWCEPGGLHAGARPGQLRQLLGLWHRRAAGVGHPDQGRGLRGPLGAVPGLVQHRRLGLRRRLVGPRLSRVEIPAQ